MTQTNEALVEHFIDWWVDDCFSEGARKSLHSILTKTKAHWLRSEIEKLEGMKEKIERVRLDVDVIICDCGEPYKDSDLDLSVGELEDTLTTIITRYKEELLELEKGV